MSRNKGRTVDRTTNPDPVVVIKKPDHRVIDLDKEPGKDKADRQREDDIAEQNDKAIVVQPKRTRKLTFQEPLAIIVSTHSYEPYSLAEEMGGGLQMDDEPNFEEHGDNADDDQAPTFKKILYGCCIHMAAYFVCIAILILTIVSGYYLSNR